MAFKAKTLIESLSLGMFARAFAGVVALMAVIPSYAQADGFVCTSVDLNTKIAIYFSPADPESEFGQMGPRATKMVVSDPTVSPKNQLIAQFSSESGLLNNSGSVVVAYVDLTHPDSSRRGERIGGTVLGALSSIIFEIDFSYQEPVEDGMQLVAQAVYTKRSGQQLVQDFDCTRYSDPAKMALELADLD